MKEGEGRKKVKYETVVGAVSLSQRSKGEGGELPAPFAVHVILVGTDVDLVV